MTTEYFNPQSGHMPDGAGGSPDDPSIEQIDLVGTASTKKRVSDATVVLVGTLLVGAGILTGMRWLGTRSLSLGVDKAIEKTVSEFLGRSTPSVVKSASADSNATERMLNSLTDDRTEGQVSLEFVKKNPFVLRLARPTTTGPTDDGGIDLAAAREQARLEERRRTLRRNVHGMRLSSIMGQPGKRVAVLNNLVVQVGDTIDQTYEIKDITAFEVVLQADGMEFRKSLTE